ncbi:Hsp33 family molecular chaperone HslO [Rhodobacteraceae bacterium DSL-40]|uniref:Hsp33 family molecular chaperone HslO n=1 Tax=Amaricoccus sp. B4 TaxID=3368557 RepID=UPI000DAE4B88
MTLAGRIAWDDMVLPFQLDRADIRGRVARVDSVLDTILGQHAYPDPVAALIAEATLLTALIGQTVRPGWRLSLQVRGGGAIRLIATDYFAAETEGEPARMRAYAAFDPDQLRADTEAGMAPFAMMGEGIFGILIDQGTGAAPYQGITPLAGESLSHCAETYFAQSEQLPTRFALAMGEAQVPGEAVKWRGGGVMLQHMPKASPFARQEASGPDGLLAAEDMLDGGDAENWNRAVILLETVEDTELIGPHVGAEDLLLRLFHEEVPRVYSAQPVQFGCTCGPEKVVESLAEYPPETIAELVTEDGKVTADCQFCGAHYEFAPEELGRRD